MEKKINRNVFWSEIFFRQLKNYGLKNVVVCPGSRNSSLVFGLHKIKQIKKYNLVDERSAGFFALGLVKKTNTPVAVVTTSGTAVAELYPAVIEAYQSRLPLIVCTADRPPELHNCGANQTINQENIFQNHIRYSLNLNAPDIQPKSINNFINSIRKAISATMKDNPGPVHINLPFRKPFEPSAKTDKINSEYYNKVLRTKLPLNLSTGKVTPKPDKYVLKNILTANKGLILFNEKNPSGELLEVVDKISKKINFPVIDDGTSGYRFRFSDSGVITNGSSLLRKRLLEIIPDPEIILQFGEAPISNSMLEFFEKSQAVKFLTNMSGDIKDPSRTFTKILKLNPVEFCRQIYAQSYSLKRNKEYFHLIKRLNDDTEKIKKHFLEKCRISFEGKIIHEIIDLIPSGSNLFVSNSMPVRDLDTFSGANNKKINVFTNRGASGIDGIISTALGIASSSKNRTILVTGDLAFYHDLNGLLASLKYKIPLTIVLINNNGGGIFDMLPVSNHKEVFDTNFKTPTNLNFRHFTEGYGGTFHEINSEMEFHKNFKMSLKKNSLTVLEIKTNSKESTNLRKKYLNLVNEQLKLAYENKL